MNFLRGRIEFSPPNLRYLILPGPKDAVISKIINRLDIRFVKPFFEADFRLLEVFMQNIEKEFSIEKNSIFSVKSSFSDFVCP